MISHYECHPRHAADPGTCTADYLVRAAGARALETIRFMAYAMTYARHEDMREIRRYVSDEDIREAIDHALLPGSWIRGHGPTGTPRWGDIRHHRLQCACLLLHHTPKIESCRASSKRSGSSQKKMPIPKNSGARHYARGNKCPYRNPPNTISRKCVVRRGRIGAIKMATRNKKRFLCRCGSPIICEFSALTQRKSVNRGTVDWR